MTTDGLDDIFNPRSVAVIGATNRKGSVGQEIMHNIVSYGFTGIVYPVHPKAEVVHSIKAYPSVLDISGPVDLAVIVVPKDHVLQVARDCAKKGVKGLVVISAGFKEMGEDGKSAETELVQICNDNNMRMIGPNCMGFINASPSVRLNCTFGPTKPQFGGATFISQSGGLGIAILEIMDELNMGLAKFVSIGNKAEVNDTDLVEYLGTDPDTNVILLYLESFGDPRRMVKIAKDISKKKPTIIVKSGRTAAGARAASSHTGALASSDTVVNDILRQMGVIRADSVEELFDYASAFQGQPSPRGRGVGIVTNGGGPGIMATDACERHGLKVVDFTDETKKKLMDLLPGYASVKNPVDLVASGDPTIYSEAVKIALQDENVDALLAMFVPPVDSDPYKIARSVASAGKASNKTVVGCFMGREDTIEGILHMDMEADIPSFMFPESAVKALKALYKRGEWLQRDEGKKVEFNVDLDKASNIISRAKADDRDELSMLETFDLLSLFGFELPKYSVVRTLEDALGAAEEIGYPVALKIVSTSISHKSDAGGVKIGLANKAELSVAFNDMDSSLGAQAESYVIQEMVNANKEVILGINRDPNFGPVVMAGVGGIFVEIMKDVSFRAAPVTLADANDMLCSLRGYPILQGARGEAPADMDELQMDIVRIAHMADVLDEIKEMDINPLVAGDKGCKNIVLDARLSLG